MKIVIKSIFYVSSIIQLLLAFVVYQLNTQYLNWMGDSFGKDEPLPLITESVLNLAPGFLLLFFALFLIGGLTTNKFKNEKLVIYLSVLFMIELVLLTFAAYGYILPSYKITTTLG